MYRATLCIFLVVALCSSALGHGFDVSAQSTPQGLQLVLANNGEPTGYDRLFAEYWFDSAPDDYRSIHGGVIRTSGFAGTVSLNIEFLSPLWFSDGNPAVKVTSGELVAGSSYDGFNLLGSVTINGTSASPSSFPVTSLSDHSLGLSLQPYPGAAGTYGFAYRVTGSQQNGSGTQTFLPSLPVVVAHSTPGFSGTGSFSVQDSLDELYEALIGGGSTPPLSPNQWASPGGGLYSAASNWADSPDAGTVPNGTGAIARFLQAITADSTITIDAPVSVGSLLFDNTHRYTLAGTSAITLSSATTAEIKLTSGDHTIAAPLAIASNTSVTASGQTLTLQGAPAWSAGKTFTVANGTLAYNTSAAASSVGAGAKLTIAAGSSVNVSGVDPFSVGSNRVAVQNDSFTGFNIISGVKAVGAITGLGQTTLAADAQLSVDSIRQAAVVLHGAADHTAAKLTVRSGAAASVSVINSLQIDSVAAPVDSNPATPVNTYFASLDLTRNKLIVDYTGASPAATIRDALQAGIGTAKNWTGTSGIITSLGDSTSFALGYAEATGLFANFPATYAGQQIDNTSVVISYTRYGDANLNGAADFSDLSLLLLSYNQSGGWYQGDFDYSGKVDFSDLSRLLLNYNQSTPLLTAAPPVPEPGTLVLACVVGVAALAYSLRGRRSKQS